MPGVDGRGYGDPRYQRDPLVCNQCGFDKFTVIPEMGVRRWFCAHCAAPFKNEYNPVDKKCPKCRTVKKMLRWDEGSLVRTQDVCDDCEQRDRTARAAWNAVMGRTV